jgi:hypothetical protein
MSASAAGNYDNFSRRRRGLTDHGLEFPHSPDVLGISERKTFDCFGGNRVGDIDQSLHHCGSQGNQTSYRNGGA